MRARTLIITLLALALTRSGTGAVAEPPRTVSWVENPGYLAWSGFSPGSWVSFEAVASWELVDPSDRHSKRVRRWTERLLRIGPERLILESRVSTGDAPDRVESHPYPREIERWIPASAVGTVLEPEWNDFVAKLADDRRTETLTVMSKRLPCERLDLRWKYLRGLPNEIRGSRSRGPSEDEQVIWYSHSIPGGVVQCDRTVSFLYEDGVTRFDTLRIRLSGWGNK